MFKKLLNWFQKSQTQSALENFIVSKNPQNAAEVDFWQREYETNKTFVWGRGL